MMTSSRNDLRSGGTARPMFTVEVETRSFKFAFGCSDDESLLTAGLRAGYDLPYECSTGTCATCHARVMSGDVYPGWPDAPGYAKLSVGKGDVLMCQARPRGDCSIRVRSSAPQPSHPAARTLRRTGRVVRLERLTRDVIHFDLALSDPMDFDAGQFVGLRHPDVEGVRAYSMVNHADETDLLRFVVKRKPGGSFSDALFELDVSLAEMEVIGPLGRATFRPDERRDFVCIAGGSGIAGMMSILSHAHQIRYFDRHRANVFFGVRTLSDAFYLAEFARFTAAAGGRLEVVIAISDEAEIDARHGEFPGIRLAAGFVHEVAAATMKGRWGDQIAFVAGPQPMVDAAIKVLITQARMKPGDIRFDKFS